VIASQNILDLHQRSLRRHALHLSPKFLQARGVDPFCDKKLLRPLEFGWRQAEFPNLLIAHKYHVAGVRYQSVAFSRSQFQHGTKSRPLLTALAIEKAGTTDRKKVRDALREVCCSAGGEVIEPGEWAKAKAAIAAGKKINYEGASGNCDFDEDGNVEGIYGHYVIENGAFKLVELLKP